MNDKKTILSLILPLFSLFSFAEKPALLPKPQQISWKNEVFKLNKPIKFISDEKSQFIVDSIQNLLKNHQISPSNSAKSTIKITIEKDISGILANKNQAYRLSISTNQIAISATNQAGLFYGFQTLKQLLVKNGFQGCDITDFPAFEMRGFMHDVGRSFISIDELKRHIAILSQYKINVFHWHLTEDIAWRLESKIYPQLTDYNTFTRFQGQCYSQNQAKELVEFCKKHHVLLIPEMDMPGHSSAFTRAMGVEMQSEKGKEIVKNLLNEWCKLFDVPYIHIGTDEVKIKDSKFVAEMVEFIENKGKKVIGWIPGGSTNEKIIRQMWTNRPHPKKGLQVIDSRNYYLNHFDTMADLVGVFNHNICDTTIGNEERLGAIACIWNDRKLKTENDIVLMNGFYPIMLTLAERAWVGGGQAENSIGVKMHSNFEEFEGRLLKHKEQHFSKLPFPYIKQSNIAWNIISPFKNKGDLSMNFPPEEGNLNFPTTKAYGASVYLRHVWGESVPAYLDNPKDSSTAYAYTYIYSPKAQKVRLWLNFHSYGRSEKDASPPQGEWDYKKSKAWLNNELIQVPTWANAGFLPTDLEKPYEDEGYELRPPKEIFLNKGWSFLLLKLPVGRFQTKEYRLVKWFFTAVFVEKNGMNFKEVDGLIYSPTKNKQN